MREILFRGKRLDNGEWVQGYYLKCPHQMSGSIKDHISVSVWDKETESSTETIYLVDAETIGQYTGLTDKNGTKIFEGDVVTCQTKYGADVGQVIFAMGKFCVWWHSEYHYPQNGKIITCYDINSKTKVIGNIFDNQNC